MITATISPPALSLSRNQIPLRLNAPDANTTAGTLGVYTEVWGDNVDDTDTQQYTWSYDGIDYDITYTFAVDNDPEAYEIEAFIGSGIVSFRNWINTNLIPGLLAHPDFNQFFTVERYEDDTLSGIRIRAREPYYAALAFAGTPTGYSTIESYTEGTAAEAATNYAARIFVSIAPLATSEAQDYLRLPEFQGYPNADGEIDIDLQPLIAPYFRDTDLPALPDADQITLLNSSPRALRIEYGQQSGDPLTRSPITAITTAKVLQGGVATHDWVDIRSALGTWFSNAGAMRLLTNRKTQRIYPGQPQHLHWYQSAAVPAGLKVGVTRKTPSSTPTSFITAGDTPTQYRNHRVPVGLSSHSGTPFTDAIEYEVFLATSVDLEITDHSERITYKVMPRPTALTIIEYQNQWGVPETIALPWNMQRIEEIEKSTYERTRPLNYALTDRAQITLAEQLTDTFELSINSNDKIDGPHIPEIILSPDTYIIIDGTTRIPCTIEPGSINQEARNRRGQQFPSQKLTITLERQISWSRILNLSNLCT